MVDDTLASRGINSIVWHGAPKKSIRRSNGSTIKPGDVVTAEGQTFPDVKLAAAGEKPFGVVLERYDIDIDTAYGDDDEFLPIASIGKNPGLGVRVKRKANAGANEPGELWVTDADGEVSIWSYADATAETDSLETIVGQGAWSRPNDASNMELIKITLGR